MAKSKYIEALEEQYTKKDAKSVLRYKAPDGKWRYVQTSKDASGGTPMPSGGGITEVTWQELKDKRDNGELNPGSLYRITDYNCTTTQENTQSAGHQFDIVLLALSENKLAEEGWAMEHPTDVYDVTFSDGVTKKCYFYVTLIQDGTSYGNVVDVETLLGIGSEGLFGVNANFVVNEEEKTATTDYYDSTALTAENLTYNYFQNSNLSAWKVWYCLDNDTDRFAWADDSVDEDSPAFITTLGEKGETYTFYRNSAYDLNNLFAWKEGSSDPSYTASQTPSVGDTIYYEDGTDTGVTVNSFTPAHEGTGLPIGRGVIYRLIDEFNNDVGYDFKNIQFVRKLTDGVYDADNGTDTWVYTLNKWDSDNSACVDATIGSNVFNCKIEAFVGEEAPTLSLGNNVCNSTNDLITDNKFIGSSCGGNTLQDCYFMYIINSTEYIQAENNNVIVIYNSTVATE